ncbi:MAG: putative 4-hydroxybenzoate polyprenyltransferase [Acidobacteriia bacterium]|nr:putative 4-hydroxybenzoate polyprenyltransferase [Terriglobia bacterium]
MGGNPGNALKPQQAPASGLSGRVRVTLEMIKFEHSVFALPFALTGALLARRGLPAWRELFWIVVAMVGARSAAMTFNRIADLKFDALNPRTKTRALPAGQLGVGFAVGFTAVSCALLVLAAWELNPLAFKLSPVAIAILLGYSFTKRFTVLSHLILGLCLGMSPAAAWIALRGDLSRSMLLLGAAVMLWVAGFDIIYACQDVEFDHSLGLHSVPRRYGIRAALWVSALLHVGTLALLVAVARMENLGWIAGAGLAAVALLLAYEHSLVKPRDLSRVNAAFFTVNGFISILFFLTWAADLLSH